jgi:hypothetical protein
MTSPELSVCTASVDAAEMSAGVTSCARANCRRCQRAAPSCVSPIGPGRAPAAVQHRTLHTNGRFERQVTVDAFVVRLEDIKPYPKEGAAIAPGDYRATLVVTRR